MARCVHILEDEESNDDVGPMPMPEKFCRMNGSSWIISQVLTGLTGTTSFVHHDVINFVVVTRMNSIVTTSVDGRQALSCAHVAHTWRFYKRGRNCLRAWQTCKSFRCRSEQNSGTIRLYDGHGDGQPLETGEAASIPHRDQFDCVIYADFVEYWTPDEQFKLPTNVPGLWSFKNQTGLYGFKKLASTPTCITLSSDLLSFVTFSLPEYDLRDQSCDATVLRFRQVPPQGAGGLHTCYMGTENSGVETRQRAGELVTAETHTAVGIVASRAS
ncbi:hypothetical protein EDB85DRAFT_452051 [Lactarius pseudohatsudake]|nr:hypothetical protein EDB85DRAFT_452051 [Lactarius pseudohatsudake]